MGHEVQSLLNSPLYFAVEDVDRTVVGWINSRRQTLMSYFRTHHTTPLVDSYHGEMGFPLHPKAKEAVMETFRSLVSCTNPLSELDGTMYSKSQPEILQRLCAERLFTNFQIGPEKEGLPPLKIHSRNVLVVPYSALAMFETIIAALASQSPHSTILCPAGFYKEFHRHIQKFGLKLRHFHTDPHENCKLHSQVLRNAIRSVRSRGEVIAAVGLTIPGNPLIATYTAAELSEIGKVFVEENVRVIVDASFESIMPHYLPLAAVSVVLDGKTHHMYDRVMTVTGLSKTVMAFGPLKLGAATSGDKAWLNAVKSQATLNFQRESTALCRTLLESTPKHYIGEITADMMKKMNNATLVIVAENESRKREVVSVVGENKYGPFLTITLPPRLLVKAMICRGHQLAEMVIAVCGIDCVSGDRVGIKTPCIRLNVHCPRVTAKKDHGLTKGMILRIFALADAIENSEMSYDIMLRSLPTQVQDILEERRIAVIGKDGAQWFKSQAWPSCRKWQGWALAEKRAEILDWNDDESNWKFAWSWNELGSTCHAVAICFSEKEFLKQWINSCKTGSIVLLESLCMLRNLDTDARSKFDSRALEVLCMKNVDKGLQSF